MHKFLLYQDKKIYYRITGDGKPVVLVHGFGEEGNVWENQFSPCSYSPGEKTASKAAFTYIIPDLPGTGQSEAINDMSIEGMAEVLHAILLEENIGCCPVIGHSMGGYITLAFVEKYRNHVSGFGLVHSSAFADSEEKKDTRRKGIAFIIEKGAFEFLKIATPKLFSPVTAEEKPALITKQVTGSGNFLPASLVSYYEAMMQRPDRTEILANATVPVLFIMGKYDTAIPLEDLLKQCHLPEKSYIHILQKSGHMGMLEEAEKCNLVLERFLLDL